MPGQETGWRLQADGYDRLRMGDIDGGGFGLRSEAHGFFAKPTISRACLLASVVARAELSTAGRRRARS
jgi:hypothetical protein